MSVSVSVSVLTGVFHVERSSCRSRPVYARNAHRIKPGKGIVGAAQISEALSRGSLT